MEDASSEWPRREDVRKISLAVLRELAPEEVEVALGYLDPLIEMAVDDELVRIDNADHAGGFGPADVLFVSVVPAVVRMLAHVGATAVTEPLPSSSEIDEALRRAAGEIESIVRRIGSQRAITGIAELLRTLHEVTRRHLTVESRGVSPRGVPGTRS